MIVGFELKMSHKAVETTCNNTAFGPGTANAHTMQQWFKKFGNGDKSLEDEEHSGWPLEVDNDQLRRSSTLTLLQLNEKLMKTQHQSFYNHEAFEAN